METRRGDAHSLLEKTKRGDEESASKETDSLLPGSAEQRLKEQQRAEETYWRWVKVFTLALAWILFGIGFLMLREGFTFVQAAYVSVQIMTTIGFGDFANDIKKGSTKVYLSVYILGCLTLGAVVLNALNTHLSSGSTNFFLTRLRRLEAHGMGGSVDQAREKFGQYNQLVVPAFLFIMSVIIGMVFYVTLEGCSCQSFGKPIAGCQIERCAKTGGRTLDLGTALYMSIVTLTTCGFGDVTPSTKLGMWFAIFWMFIGVALTGNFLLTLTQFLTHQDCEKSYQLKIQISKDIFDKMDLDGSGTISMGEYRRFVLLRFGLVEEEVLNAIDNQYKMLDKQCGCSGSVTFDQISALYKDDETQAS